MCRSGFDPAEKTKFHFSNVPGYNWGDSQGGQEENWLVGGLVREVLTGNRKSGYSPQGNPGITLDSADSGQQNTSLVAAAVPAIGPTGRGGYDGGTAIFPFWREYEEGNKRG